MTFLVGARREAREHITRESLDNRLRHISLWPRGTGRILMIKYSRGTCIPWNVTSVSYAIYHTRPAYLIMQHISSPWQRDEPRRRYLKEINTIYKYIYEMQFGSSFIGPIVNSWEPKDHDKLNEHPWGSYVMKLK